MHFIELRKQNTKQTILRALVSAFSQPTFLLISVQSTQGCNFVCVVVASNQTSYSNSSNWIIGYYWLHFVLGKVSSTFLITHEFKTPDQQTN